MRDWMPAHLSQPQGLEMLARRAHMSRRTLIRRFQQETGTSPVAWLTSARIDWARELLETTTTPVEQVARLSGLGSPAAFRNAFHHYVGTAPQHYRMAFRHHIGQSTPENNTPTPSLPN